MCSCLARYVVVCVRGAQQYGRGLQGASQGVTPYWWQTFPGVGIPPGQFLYGMDVVAASRLGSGWCCPSKNNFCVCRLWCVVLR